MRRQSTQLGAALAGFGQAVAQARANKEQQERARIARQVDTARIAELEARTQNLRAPQMAAQAIGLEVDKARHVGAPFDIQSVDPYQFLGLSGYKPEGLIPFVQDAEQRSALALAGGQQLDKNNVFGVADREAVAARDQANEIEQIFAKPVTVGAGAKAFTADGRVLDGNPSLSSARAGILNQLSPEMQQASVLPRTAVTRPDGTITETPTYGPVATSAGTKDLQMGLLEKEKFTNLIDRVMDIVDKDKFSVGAVGNISRMGQRTAGIASDFAGALGYENPEKAMSDVRRGVAEAIARSGGDTAMVREVYNPNLDTMQQFKWMLAYSAASALAGQSGRSVTDKDLRAALQMSADPTGWLTDSASFKTKLANMKTSVQELADAERRALGLPPVSGGGGGAPQTAASAGIRIDAEGRIIP